MYSNSLDNNINLDSTDEKLDFIESIIELSGENDKIVDTLILLSKDKDEEVRYRTAEALGNYNTERVEKVLLEMLSDTNELVRVFACESLSYIGGKDSIINLQDILMNDRSCLVRGYSAEAIADILKRITKYDDSLIDLLEHAANKEKTKTAKVMIYTALYKLGKKYYLELL